MQIGFSSTETRRARTTYPSQRTVGVYGLPVPILTSQPVPSPSGSPLCPHLLPLQVAIWTHHLRFFSKSVPPVSPTPPAMEVPAFLILS